MAGDAPTVERFSEREAHENAREDAGEQAYDDDADVQPCKAGLVEVSGRRTLVCRSKVILVSRLDRWRAMQSVRIRMMKILLVVVHARVALPCILQHPTPEFLKCANIVPRTKPLAPQIWCILVRRISGKVVCEGVRRTRRRKCARGLNRWALRTRTNSSPWYSLYADSSSCLCGWHARCGYAQSITTPSPESVRNISLLIVFVYGARCISFDGGRIAL